VIFMIVIWVASAFLCAYVGGQKNRDHVSWFLAGLFFGVFGVIAVIAVPTLTDEEQRKQDRGTSLKPDSEMEEWDILAKYDPSTRSAVQKLDQYGPEALNELKRAYTVVKNKDQMPAIADEIINDIKQQERQKNLTAEEKEAQRLELMEKYGITFDGTKYICQTYRYGALQDALNYAKLTSGE